MALLSRREHSRRELARKLASHEDAETFMERVLDELVREGWLSDERYAQSLVHRRSRTHGAARIVSELRLGGVDDAAVAEIRDSLRSSEYERAKDVWQRRFGGAAPADRQVFAKQARFLAARGFGNDVIYRILGEAPEAPEAPEACD